MRLAKSRKSGVPFAALLRSNIAALLTGVALSAAELVAGSPAVGQISSIDSAFAAVRRGRFAVVAELKLNPADIPAVARFLNDGNEDVRREAVVLLIKLGEPACQALKAALVDAEADLRERAARGIHGNCPARETAHIADLDAALRRSVDMGNTAAAALLLLGRFDNEATRSYLEGRIASKDHAVKLNSWNPPVPQRLAAAVGGVSAAVPDAEAVVERGLGLVNEAEFVALTLGDIRPATKLSPLLRLLDDRRTVASGTPSGATPQRRICDLALDSLVRRLSLQPLFQLRPADRYTDAEIAQVRELATAAVTKG
jgi:HEAT repeat protein